MSKNEWKKLVGVAGRLLLALAFVFSQTAWAGQNQQTKDKTDSQQKATAQQASEKQSFAGTTAKAQSNQAQSEESEGPVAEEKLPNDGSHQGIKVHGHWTIEVRNPDGTVVTHREFENSLVSDGASFLVSVLDRNYSVSGWWVNLSQSTGGGPCASGLNNLACTIAEPNILGPAGNVFTDLSLTTTSTSTGGLRLVLSGTAIAGVNGGAIDTVTTVVANCGATAAPSPLCTAITGHTAFTSAAVSPAVNVNGGQTIAVTVVISFS